MDLFYTAGLRNRHHPHFRRQGGTEAVALLLWRCSQPGGHPIAATEGRVGSVDDLLFDAARWTLRRAVANTARWLSGRKFGRSETLDPPAVAGIDSRRARCREGNEEKRRCNASEFAWTSRAAGSCIALRLKLRCFYRAFYRGMWPQARRDELSRERLLALWCQ
jgi:hypothetical protein